MNPQPTTSSDPTPMSDADAWDLPPQLLNSLFPDDPFQEDGWQFAEIGGLRYQLRSDWVLVELTQPSRVLPSGIVLPEVSVENHEEGIVKAVGPGVECENGLVVPTQLFGEEQVYFPKHAFYALDLVQGSDQRLGMVRERDLVAYSHPVDPDTLVPMNDWLMLERTGSDSRKGSIVLPQVARRPPDSGLLLDFGRGLPVTHGELAGARRPIYWDMGEDDSPTPYVSGGKDGIRIYWHGETKRVTIANMDGHDPYVFIRARDAIAFVPA